MRPTEFASRPRYLKTEEELLLFNELRRLVHQEIERLPKSRLYFARIRAVVLILTYILLYIFALQQRNVSNLFYLVYFLMGIIAVLIFVNVIHESCHGNLFDKKIWNIAFYHFFDLLGMNSYIWEKRHNILHHNFPNVDGWDSDIEQSTFFKIYPNGKSTSLQRFQHRFFFFLYPFYLANWVIVRDFKDYLNKKQIVRKVTKIPAKEWYKLLVFKAFFILYTIIIPWQLFGFSFGQSVLALLIMLSFGSIFSMAILLAPHANAGNQFPQPDAHSKTPNT